MELLYSFEIKKLEPGEYFLRKGDPTEDLFVVTYGHMQFVTEVDGNNFVIENLYQGSVFNHHLIFTEDFMMVDVKADCHTYVAILSETKFNDITAKFPAFEKKVGFFKNRLFRSSNIIPLNYQLYSSKKEKRKRLDLTVRLKNVVFKILDYKKV